MAEIGGHEKGGQKTQIKESEGKIKQEKNLSILTWISSPTSGLVTSKIGPEVPVKSPSLPNAEPIGMEGSASLPLLLSLSRNASAH